MQYTTKLKLKKPDITDYVNIADINDNMEIIDTEIAKMTDAETGIEAKQNQHAVDKNNPHVVTKAQVGLGSVQNFGVASQVEAETGTSADKYMTPERTIQAIEKKLTPLNNAVTQHLEQTMPHQFTDSTSGKTFKWGMGAENGIPFLLIEEVL